MTKRRVALVGNPNAGKTSLFNALTGLHSKTANFPGTTLDIRIGRLRSAVAPVELIDMPGLYSLAAADAEERAALNALLGGSDRLRPPDAFILLLDATHLERNLFLASQMLELGRPVAVALNMMDVADRLRLKIDHAALAEALGCPVVPVSARKGTGVAQLRAVVEGLIAQAPPADAGPAPVELLESSRLASSERYEWAETVTRRVLTRPEGVLPRGLEWLDALLTHSVAGPVCFLAVMLGVFYLIFQLATYPMGWIDAGVVQTGALLSGLLPAGPVRGLLVDGIVGGVGGVLVFLPQICLLFFSLTLLEDSGYLARAALVMDRAMRRVGLPGKAFVPMLSAHACAVPAIMATKIIENRRDRLVTIMIIPLLTCSARLPVYAMVTAMLFPDAPGKAALLFTGAYSLGIVAAIGAAFVLRRTILPGQTQPLMIELPDYRLPHLRQAVLFTWERARVFLAKAGTVILAISVVLWWLSNFPGLVERDLPPAEQAQLVALQRSDPAAAETYRSSLTMEHSFAGRLGRAIEPVIEPLGFNWQIGVGVISSFAAREVIVSTLSILYGAGSDDTGGLIERMQAARRPDGTPVFTTATSLSLLIFFVLAMQCLPTQAVTKRETGQWRWAFLQLGYMTALAYGASLVAYQALAAFGFA